MCTAGRFSGGRAAPAGEGRARMSGAITLRPYRPDDCDALVALFRAAVRKVAIRDYTAAQVEAWAPEHIDGAAWDARRRSRPTWVAELDGRIAGFTDLEADGHIDMLFVSPDHQGRGIATALYCQVGAAAREAKLSRLYTEASITARPFFARHGFRVIAEQTVHRREVALVNYSMEKQLP